ncbi:probable neurochondrin at N-terminal half [Coccomyxa sp. Obi]|nr:probable neurochondrin at N-terminal half [Coccomyxa sp. Obi]
MAEQHQKRDASTHVALEECIQLLKGPTDERRFVGLLLVTKLLPAGDAGTIRAVYDSVGSQFIARLLLPLRQPQITEHSEQSRQKDASACMLTLAVLASSCRLSDIAAREEVMDKVPLFIKVVKNGGISQLLNMPGRQIQAQDWRRMDEEAVKDALECLLAVAAASPDGHTICLESGALAAACSALQAKGSNTGIEARSALALHLLGVLLQRAEHDTVLVDSALDVATAVPAVASFMVLDTRSGSSVAAAAQKGKQQEPGQAPAPPAPDLVDPVALQLEALLVLLLILSSPSPQVEECLLASAKAAAKSETGWPLQARSGIATLLRGRLAPAQRQTALQVAASILGLVGPEWLLAPSHDGGNLPEAFFQLLVEVIKVEALITLRDALSPDAHVPLSHAPRPSPERPSTSAGTAAEPSSSAPMEQDSDDDDTQGFAPMMPPLERPAPLVDECGSDIEPNVLKDHSSSQQRRHSSGQPSTADGQTELAGERAARVLPAVFALAEGCVEALATDSMRAEAMTDASAADLDMPEPVLSDRVATRAMSSLQETHEAILQYLEAARQGEVEASDPIILAAARSLGRFLAEAPDAFAERMQKLLPFLLTVQQGQATPFLLPVLLQVVPQASEEEGTDTAARAWLAALLDKQVLEALARHTSQTAEDARKLWAAALQGASSGAWASAEAMLLPAVEILCSLQQNASQAGWEVEQVDMAQALLGTVQPLAHWAQERGRASPLAHEGPSPASLQAVDSRLLVSVGGLVASTLLVAIQRGRWASQQLEEDVKAVLGSGARVVSHAIEEGFVRLAVAKRKAMERAQQQLSGTGIPSGGPVAPGVSAGSSADDWLEDIRDVWTEAVRTTTLLAEHSADFAAAVEKLKPLWSEDGGAWANVSPELQRLREAVFGRSSV